MDITLTDADNLPDKAYLSIRAGDVRKQLQYRIGQELRFDFKAGQAALPKHVAVDVFEKIGSAQVRLADLPQAPDGADGDLECKVAVASDRGLPVKLGMRVQIKEPDSMARKPLPRISRHQAALDAKSYLDGNCVQRLLQEMVHELLAEKPTDAVSFMMGYLQRARAQSTWRQECELLPCGVQPAVQNPKVDCAAEMGGNRVEPGAWAVDGNTPLPDLKEHRSIVARVLSQDVSVYPRLQALRTPLGVSLAQCMKSGVENKGHPMVKFMGLVAGDEECYTLFKDVFEPSIEMWHGHPLAGGPCPINLDASQVRDVTIDRDGCRVVSVEVSVGRNLRGFRMNPVATPEERCSIEQTIRAALLTLGGDFAGCYEPLNGSQSCSDKLGGMTLGRERELIQDRLLFSEPETSGLRSAGFAQCWPEARGIFVSHDRSSILWVNEADHLRIICRRQDQDVKAAFERLVATEQALKAALLNERCVYAYNERLGFLSTCPSNIGTGLHVMVTLRIPQLGSNDEELKRLCRGLGLNISMRLSAVAGQPEADMCWDVTCRPKLGMSEVMQIQTILTGCKQLLEMESELEGSAEVSKRVEQEPHDASDAIPVEGPAVVRTGEKLLPSNEGHAQTSSGTGSLDMPDLSKRHSIAARVLRSDPTIYARLRDTSTPMGTAFAQCIKTCFDNCGHPMIKMVGIVAGDAGCYDVFRQVFDPVIQLRHPHFDQTKKHITDMDSERVHNLPLDPSGGDHVLSVCVRVSRNLRQLRMPPSCSFEERRRIELLARAALDDLPSDLQGKYYPLRGSTSNPACPDGMTIADEDTLREGGVLFEEPDSQVLISAGYGRDWPDARGVFVDAGNSTVVSVNEVDHLRIAAVQPGSDLSAAYRRLCRLHDKLETSLELAGHGYVRDSRLGFLCSCPSRVGTSLDVMVTLRIPLVSSRPEFRSLCRQLKLQAHMAVGQNFVMDQGLWEVMNMERLGSTEVEQVNKVISGCRVLLELEGRLERSEDIEVLMTPRTLAAKAS